MQWAKEYSLPQVIQKSLFCRQWKIYVGNLKEQARKTDVIQCLKFMMEFLVSLGATTGSGAVNQIRARQVAHAIHRALINYFIGKIHKLLTGFWLYIFYFRIYEFAVCLETEFYFPFFFLWNTSACISLQDCMKNNGIWTMFRNVDGVCWMSVYR